MESVALDGDFEGTFPFEARYLTAGDVRLHYVDEGPADAPALLFVHGNPTWSYLWRRPVAELSAKGRRCVAFDHMGFGRSDKPPQLGRYHLDAHVGNLVSLLDQLDLRDILLVVHDWGGPIGFGALLERRERFRAALVTNSWAWELPSFLPPFLREFRTDGLGEILALAGNMMVESIPGGMASRRVDQRMMEAYRAPFPDYWSCPVPLAFQRDIPLSERGSQRRDHGPHPLRPERARPAAGPGVGHARSDLPARVLRRVARAVPLGAADHSGGRRALPARGQPD